MSEGERGKEGERERERERERELFTFDSDSIVRKTISEDGMGRMGTAPDLLLSHGFFGTSTCLLNF